MATDLASRMSMPDPARPEVDPSTPAPRPTPPRRRLSHAERREHIVQAAIGFFAEQGFNGQLRDLALRLGVTHALLYHYFPTKQALIDSVYEEVFVKRWQPRWDLLEAPCPDTAEDALTAFYLDYVNRVLSPEFVRILVFSGLADRSITDRFFARLRTELFPALIRVSRCARGARLSGRTGQRELELLMGLHGGLFHVSLQRWVYGQSLSGSSPAGTSGFQHRWVRDRVRAYLQAGHALFTPR